MTKDQVINAIERGKCCLVQVSDSAGNMLAVIEGNTAQNVVSQIEEIITDFRGYKKLQIKGVEKKGVNWSKGFCWFLEFEKAEVATAAPAASINGISADVYVNMMERMLTRQSEIQKESFELQKQIFEKTLQMNNQDPTKWLPVIQTVGPMLGFNQPGQAAAIQGPPTSQLEFGDTTKMNAEEIGNLVNNKLTSIATKVSGSQMLSLVSGLDKIPTLPGNIDKITTLLNVTVTRPELLDQLINYLQTMKFI